MYGHLVTKYVKTRLVSIEIRVEAEIKLSLCLTTHHNIKMCRGVEVCLRGFLNRALVDFFKIRNIVRLVLKRFPAKSYLMSDKQDAMVCESLAVSMDYEFVLYFITRG